MPLPLAIARVALACLAIATVIILPLKYPHVRIVKRAADKRSGLPSDPGVIIITNTNTAPGCAIVVSDGRHKVRCYIPTNFTEANARAAFENASTELEALGKAKTLTS